jgi:hypothetical protein
MTMTEGIFDKDGKPINSEVDVIKPYASELVGEGKKFRTVEDLEKGKTESDSFIEQLKGENAGLRKDLDERMTTAEALEKIREENASHTPSENTTPGLDTDAVTNLVEKTIEQKDFAKIAAQNIAEVDQKMKALYGEKAKEVFEQKAAAIGLSSEYLQDVASKSPSAFFNVLGLEVKKSGGVAPVVTQGDLRSEVEMTPSVVEHSWAWFETLRKDNPIKYWKPETQNILFKARMEQGDKFGLTQT